MHLIKSCGGDDYDDDDSTKRQSYINCNNFKKNWQTGSKDKTNNLQTFLPIDVNG